MCNIPKLKFLKYKDYLELKLHQTFKNAKNEEILIKIIFFEYQQHGDTDEQEDD